jgi:hypothetical protein
MLDAEGNNARRAILLHNTKLNRPIGEIECASSRSRRGYSVKGVDHNGSGHGGCETLKRRKDETSARLASIMKAQFLRRASGSKQLKRSSACWRSCPWAMLTSRGMLTLKPGRP